MWKKLLLNWEKKLCLKENCLVKKIKEKHLECNYTFSLLNNKRKYPREKINTIFELKKSTFVFFFPTAYSIVSYYHKSISAILGVIKVSNNLSFLINMVNA